MEINRDNYEEYFLMYVDNELTDAEKVAVLMFVKQNKDLEEEFRRIHYTISKPDENVELPDKSFLFRRDTSSFIRKDNYEEIFVLYHDHELSAAEVQATDDFLAENRELNNEFELIGIARLTPEQAMVFPGKKALYRSEKNGRVAPLFWRLLAAAVFIGCGLWILGEMFLRPKTSVHLQAMTVHPKSRPSTVATAAADQNKRTQPLATAMVPVRKKASSSVAFMKKAAAKTPALQEDVAVSKIAEGSIHQMTVSTQPGEITALEKSEIKSLTAGAVRSSTAIDPAKALTRTVAVSNEEGPASNVDAKTASYVATDDNQNYVFYNVTTTEFRKTKVGGLFKKIKRVIARTNPIGRLIAGNDRQLATKS